MRGLAMEKSWNGDQWLVARSQFLTPQPLKITAIRNENATTKTFILDGKLAAEPGQFVMVWLPGMEDKPFSLAGVDPINLTVATVGPVSQFLHQLQVGNFLWVRGPLGRGYSLPDVAGGRLILIGGGYGVAPMHFLAREALAAGFEVAMIIGARTAEGLLWVDEFKALGVDLFLTTEDGSAGQAGMVTDALRQVVVNSPVMGYACGPIGMLVAVGDFFTAKGIPVQLSWEAYMRCGLGLCGSCEIGQGWLTCLDGPVFPFNPLTINPQDCGK
jgi:dihydroorotate dehydrogenase electron transfer subunit